MKHERSEYLNQTLLNNLNVEVPVSLFLLLTSKASFYNKFYRMSQEEKHQVINSFFAPQMIEMIPNEAERYLEIIKQINPDLQDDDSGEYLGLSAAA